MTVDFNPVSIAHEIRSVSDRLERSTGIIAEAYEKYLKAKREYGLAMAVARQNSSGSSNDARNDDATVQCVELWLVMDTADVAYKYSRDLCDALEKKLSALQTEAKMAMSTWNATA